jgi:hypothetical protein
MSKLPRGPSVLCPASFLDDHSPFTSDFRPLIRPAGRGIGVKKSCEFGNYGLRGPEFTAMIEARWRELMGL